MPEDGVDCLILVEQDGIEKADELVGIGEIIGSESDVLEWRGGDGLLGGHGWLPSPACMRFGNLAYRLTILFPPRFLSPTARAYKILLVVAQPFYPANIVPMCLDIFVEAKIAVQRAAHAIHCHRLAWSYFWDQGFGAGLGSQVG